MSDTELRSLERAHQAGDPGATELLIRYLERAGEEHAKCKVNGHAYGEPESTLARLEPGMVFRLTPGEGFSADTRARLQSAWESFEAERIRLSGCTRVVICTECGDTQPVHGVRRRPNYETRGRPVLEAIRNTLADLEIVQRLSVPRPG